MSTLARGLAGMLVLEALLAGCARAPVLSESARLLDHDLRSLLAEGAERLGPPGARPAVAVPATRECGSGRARETLSGRISLHHSGSTGVTLDHASDVMLEMIYERGYRLERPPTADVRTFTMARELPEVRLTVRPLGGRQPALVVDGVTPCLPG